MRVEKWVISKRQLSRQMSPNKRRCIPARDAGRLTQPCGIATWLVLLSPGPVLGQSAQVCLQEVFEFPGCNLFLGNLHSFIRPPIQPSIHPSTHSFIHSSTIHPSFANIECFQCVSRVPSAQEATKLAMVLLQGGYIPGPLGYHDEN